jgi:hypothetical protein
VLFREGSRTDAQGYFGKASRELVGGVPQLAERRNKVISRLSSETILVMGRGASE